tara:strand:- start:5446 stop:6381 length:936 start_codon:yes stop_codon:yes gene_type:complete
MLIRPKDYIGVDDKLFFAVVSEFQEENRALTWLRYIKDEHGMRKLATEQAGDLISDSYPEFQFHSHYADSDLHGIPLGSIGHIYQPDQTVTRLLNMTRPDGKQRDAIKILKLLLDAGIQEDHLGISGSLMLDTHNEKSDIDIIIYGRELFYKVRQSIKNYIESGELEALDNPSWIDAFQRRSCDISFEDYCLHEKRKFNKCISGTSKVDISMIPEVSERFQENGPFQKQGREKIESIVTDDTYAYDFPARYFTDHETISEVVSYTATYIGQVQKGERIEAAGYVEQDSDGKTRLLVGTSREAAGEYIRVAD